MCGGVDPGRSEQLRRLAGVRKLSHGELDDARPLLDVCERVEHGVAEPSFGPVILDRDDRRRDRAQRLGVDRLDRVEVDHARLDPVAGQRLRRLQRLVERDPGADQGDVVALAQRPRAADREVLVGRVEHLGVGAGRAEVRDPVEVGHGPDERGRLVAVARDTAPWRC